MKQQIEKIIDNFNFQEVYDHLASAGIMWEEDGTTPTIEEITETAKVLLMGVYNSEEMHTTWRWRGFHASKLVLDPDRSPSFELKFVIEDSYH